MFNKCDNICIDLILQKQINNFAHCYNSCIIIYNLIRDVFFLLSCVFTIKLCIDYILYKRISEQYILLSTITILLFSGFTADEYEQYS